MINPVESELATDKGTNSFEVLNDEAAILPPVITPEIGQKYYTRFTLYYERSSWPATNYERGALLHFNSEVLLVEMSVSDVTLLLTEDKKKIDSENIEKYTETNLMGFGQRLLSAESTPINKYGDEIAGYIVGGDLQLGMTKQQVLLTRGYPPKHVTDSLEEDRWVY